MEFEKKKEVAKVLARSIMNTMMEQNVPLEDCVEIIGMTAAQYVAEHPHLLNQESRLHHSSQHSQRHLVLE